MKKNKTIKKLEAIMLIAAMAIVSVPAVTAPEVLPDEWPCADEPHIHNIETIAEVAGVTSGGGGGSTGGGPCIVDLPSDPVTMSAYYSYDDSFFKTTLSGVPPGYDVTNGVYNGWCIDYGTPMPINISILVNLFSSYCPPVHLDHANWSYVNYLINNKQSDYYNDTQTAIWYFINLGPWTVAPTPIGQNMVNDALANGAGFVPGPGQLVAVLCDPVNRDMDGDGTPDVQFSFIEVVVPDIPEDGTPVIKCKWEYDLGPGPHDGFAHDSCITPGLQVAPNPGGFVKVGYYAVVTDPQGRDHIDHVYADIWHPDGEFKYQIELRPVGLSASGYDKTIALKTWDHVISVHRDIITVNDDWAMQLDPGINWWDDVRDELNEPLAYMFYGEALLSYCQPGGYYTVGVRAHDAYNIWTDYLWNWFWYIPTAAIQIDFNTVDYGVVAESFDQWVGGDYDMDTSHKPTVRNIGNCPVELWVIQDDMDFGTTDGRWNVQFDAQLTADERNRVYYPPNTRGPVRIPGIVNLCTMEKLDFSIHVYKGYPGIEYKGNMGLFAFIHDASFIWGTRPEFIGDAPNGVPQNVNIVIV
jgi:hypothetical protein